MTIIPVGLAASQVFSMILETRKVTIRLVYIALLDRWTIDLDRDEVTILSGQRLVTGIDMLGAYNFKLGALFCIAGDGPGDDPGRNDFEERLQLIHVSEDEIEAVST